MLGQVARAAGARVLPTPESPGHTTWSWHGALPVPGSAALKTAIRRAFRRRGLPRVTAPSPSKLQSSLEHEDCGQLPPAGLEARGPLCLPPAELETLS